MNNSGLKYFFFLFFSEGGEELSGASSASLTYLQVFYVLDCANSNITCKLTEVAVHPHCTFHYSTKDDWQCFGSIHLDQQHLCFRRQFLCDTFAHVPQVQLMLNL